MPALITELIEGSEACEIVRDQIAAILVVESAAQQALATADNQDPKLWSLRVFLERANPWAEFGNGADNNADADPEPAQIDATPIVNVSFDSDAFDKSKGNVVEKQQAEAVFHVDCYGYGVSAGNGSGHTPGDAKAALEAQRAARLVRRILMAGHYVRLGLPMNTIGRRWLRSRQQFQPASDNRHVQHVVGVRLSFEVIVNETAPQIVGEELELISTEVLRSETGEVYLIADYPGA